MRTWVTVMALLGLAGCAGETSWTNDGRSESTGGAQPPNVVLVIGDGFGMGAWTLARRVAELEGEELAMDRPEASGFLETHCLDEIVTDSAAAATAWATGRLAPRFQVGFPEQDGANLLERLRADGRAFGFVSTARVTHYTLAPFYGRAQHRRAENELAEQLVEAAPDVAVGGGARHFLPSDAGGRRADGRDLLAEAESGGTAVLRRFDGSFPEDAPVLAVLADAHLPHELDRASDEPDLVDLAVAAVRRLQSTGRPWFLLVEAARIDHAGHDHDGPGLARNTLRLDRALRGLLQETDRSRTLVVLGADHETGNPTLLEFAHPESLGVVTSSVDAMERRVFGGRGWTGTPRSLTAKALPVLDEGARHTGLESVDLDRLLSASDVYERRTALGNAVSRRFGIAFIAYRDHLRSENVHGHNGDLVPVRAWGPRASEIRGIRNHAELGVWIADVLGLPAETDGGAEPASD